MKKELLFSLFLLTFYSTIAQVTDQNFEIQHTNAQRQNYPKNGIQLLESTSISIHKTETLYKSNGDMYGSITANESRYKNLTNKSPLQYFNTKIAAYNRLRKKLILEIVKDTSSKVLSATVLKVSTSNNTAPTAVITAYKSNATNTPFTAVFTFSKPIQNFDLSDVVINNGTASIFNKISNSKYTALITPIIENTVTIQIPANAVQDLSNNNNTSSNVFNIIYDVTPPTLLITSDTTNPTNISSFVATFTFSEGMDDFDASYFSLINATSSNFVSVNRAVYTATITPIIDGTVTISVAADETEDFAGNSNAAAQYSTQIDTVKPTVSISSTVANPTNEAFTAIFTFSEDVANFMIGDIMLNNATASSFKATSTTVYTVVITPTTDGEVSIDIAAGVANDAATNTNTAATQFTTNYDNTQPTVSITSTVANPTNEVFTATFTFSEAVNGFIEDDLTLNNAVASNFTATSTSVYTAFITPTADGEVSIEIATGVAIDAATNTNTAATQFTTTYDGTEPTVSITSTATNPTNEAFTATFSFSEAVNGFVVDDLTLDNATASSFTATSATVYNALITPTIDGEVSIDIAAGAVNDAANNINAAASKFTTYFDGTKPTVRITSAVANPTNDTFTATITFSEAVNGFVVDDLTLNNAVASNFTATSATVYTAVITPTTDGEVSISIAASVANDTANNTNTAAAQFTTNYDRTQPTVRIASTTANPTNEAFTATFTFSEDVANFVVGDLMLYNATASNFISKSASVYTAFITPITDGEVSIDITADVANDAANNANTDATQFALLYDATPPSVPIVVGIDRYTCVSSRTTTADTSLVFNGTAEANSMVQLFVNDTSIGTTTATSNGSWTFDATSTTLSDATYNITATAKDAATNTSELSDKYTIIIDTEDFDQDGNPDFCDEDDDNDGVLDVDDNSKLPNPDQADTDTDGIADVDEDCDNDGIVNYYDTDVVTCQAGIVLKKAYGFSPNGDGINDTWTIEDIQLFPKNMVHIYNRSGKLVYSMKGYDNSFNGVSNKTGSRKKLPVGPYAFTIEFSTPNAKAAKGWIYINY